MHRNKRTSRIVFVVMFLLLATSYGSSGKALSALVWIKPPDIAIPANATTTVEIQMDNIADVYGAEYHLSFDPSVLAVVDKDSNKAGIQIAPGICPQPGFVAVNSADNTTGKIGYALTQLNPQQPCNGGLAASIEFKCLGTVKSSAIVFDSIIISDRNGIEIPADTQDGRIQCGFNTFLPLIKL